MSIDNVTIHQGYELPNGTNTLAHDVVRLINALTSIDSDVFLRPLASSSTYVGTTAIALNRASAAQALTGITSIDGSAATLTTSRTLWGQSFNGSANVTGNLTSVGNITGSGAISLTTAAASNLSLASGTTGIVTLDSGTTGAVNIGTGANTKTITIGSSTGTVQLPTAVTKVGQTSLIQGGAVNVTFPTLAGTLVGSGDTGTVTSTMILNGTILDADINASAAIAGTKISPDFGSQNSTTTGTSTAASFIPTSATVPTNGLYLSAANTVALATSSTGKVFVDSSGRVGIATATPGEKLTVAGTAGSAAISLLETGVRNWAIRAGGAVTNSFDVADLTAGATRLTINSSGNVNIVGSGTAGSTQTVSFNGSAPVDSLVLDGSGRCGLGTGSPTMQLQVLNGGTGNNTNNGAINLCRTLTVGSTIYHTYNTAAADEVFAFSVHGGTTFSNTSYTKYLASAGGTHIWYGATTASERMRITNAGLVGIGTTSPTYQLELSTDSAGKPSTVLWTITSDERIKEDIELADLDLCYEAIKTIPLKRYKWRDDIYSEEQVTDRRKLGWIAQDVETVFPKAISVHEFKYNQVFEETIIPAVEKEVDDEGNITTPAQPERVERGELISEDVIEDCKDLNADQIYAALYGAVQKLIAKVEALEIEVTRLKA